jgi:hypothetical protein
MILCNFPHLCSHFGKKERIDLTNNISVHGSPVGIPVPDKPLQMDGNRIVDRADLLL